MTIAIHPERYFFIFVSTFLKPVLYSVFHPVCYTSVYVSIE